MGVPTSSQCGEEGLGNELGSGRCDWNSSSPRSLGRWYNCCGWSVAGLGWRAAGFSGGVVLGPCGAGQTAKSNAAWAAAYWRVNAWVVGRRRCAEWSDGLGAVNAAWAAGRPERRRGPVDCRRVRGACAAGWPEVRHVVLLHLLVMRRSCGYGAWCSAATCGGSLSVCSVMLSINRCYSRRGSPIIGASSG